MSRSEPTRWTVGEMLTLASRGLGKVDAHGRRGATLVSLDEIEAMAGALALFGLAATPPGSPSPEPLIVPTRGVTA